jgi:hypothetical protein
LNVFDPVLEVRLLLIQSNKDILVHTALKRMAISLLLCLCASLANAQSFLFSQGGDDTILIEKEASTKIPYSRIAKAVVNHVFNVNVQQMFSGGKNNKTACVRNFSEYADRTKYRVGVKKDKVEVKFSLNF